MPPTLTELCKKSEMITQKTKEIRHEIKRIEKKELKELKRLLIIFKQASLSVKEGVEIIIKKQKLFLTN